MLMQPTRVSRSQKSVSVTWPAPVGGWNARDNIANMPKSDAALMVNWFPTTSDLMLRQGWTSYATGLGGQVNKLMAYNSGTLSKMFGASGSNVYDATNTGSVGAASLSGMSSDKWIHSNITTSGGSFLVMVNGIDSMKVYNGTAWESIGNGVGETISSLSGNGTTVTVTTATPHGLLPANTVTISSAATSGYNVTTAITVTGSNTFTYSNATTGSGAGATYTYAPSVTGVSTNLWNFVTLTKNRLWFVEKLSTRAWYLPIQSIAGTANVLDMGTVFRRGGYLVAIGSWSNTGGFGAQDLTCFISSEGEMSVYQGIDPSQTGGWNLVGLYYIGTPLGNNCFTKAGTDLLVITKQGLIGLSQGQFFADVSGQKSSLTDKIQWAISAATSDYSVNYGWQIQVFPLQNMLILNVPVGLGLQEQYVMNTITGSWTKFIGIPANCFELLNDQLYFGGNGYVGKAWNGYSDNGSSIKGDVISAFSNFGSPARQKQYKMARPIITSGALSQISVGICIDYNINTVAPQISGASIAASLWDTAIWDQSYWVSATSLTGEWVTIQGLGYNAALRLTASTSTPMRFSATDILFENGRVL